MVKRACYQICGSCSICATKDILKYVSIARIEDICTIIMTLATLTIKIINRHFNLKHRNSTSYELLKN